MKKWEPIRPPWRGSEQAVTKSDLVSFEGDVAGRIADLFANCGLNPDAGPWKLALALAIKHKEPGFALAALGDDEDEARKLKADQQNRCDELMDYFINGGLTEREAARVCEPGGRVFFPDDFVPPAVKSDGKKIRRPRRTQAAAAKLVYKVLQQEQRDKNYAGIIPSPETIRAQYSKRRTEKIRRGENPQSRPLPKRVRETLHWIDLFNSIHDVALKMARTAVV